MPVDDRCRIAHACFSRPHSAEGQSVQSVYSFLQDSVGFMWVGTQRGLVRFDSANVRHFKSDPDTPFSVPGKFVLSIGEDQRGDIWIGTYDGGPARFDVEHERFHRVDLQPWNEHDSITRGFVPMSDGRMWVATHGSLTAVGIEDGSVSKFRHPEVAGASHNVHNRFTKLLLFDDRHLLVGTAAGLFLFDTLRESFQHLPYDQRGLLKRWGNGVVNLIRASDRIVASTRDQLYALDDDVERFELLEPFVNLPGEEAYWVIESLAPDSVEGRLWVGTSNGLLRWDGNDESPFFFRADDSDPRTPYGLEIHSLMHDRSGTLWIGTGGGLSFLDLRYNFRYCRVSNEAGEAMSNALTLASGDRSKVWVGTPEGFFEYDLDTDRAERHDLGGGNENDRRDRNTVREIHKGREDWWIGTANGLVRWDPLRCVVADYFSPDMRAGLEGNMRQVLGPSVKGLLEDSKGFVWSGSDTMGMQCYDPRSNTFRYYRRERGVESGLPHDTMMTSLEDRDGMLWFGFVTCLARYDRERDAFERFVHDPDDRTSLSNNMILSMREDGRGRLWVGTASGLNRVVQGEDGSISFVRYSLRQGLPVDFIVSILEHKDELWLGTNRGIVRFRERSDGIDARLYDTSDGLHDREYALASAMRDEDGWLHFGGGAGFDRFHPEHIRPNTTPPPVVLTELRLFNRPVPIVPHEEQNGETFALPQSIRHTEELSLSYRQSVITICYAALHYLQPEKIRYQYRLNGFDREWIDAQGRTEVTYTNLDPGEYLFQVRAINSDGCMSEHPAELTIHMEPPPWRTWWAHLLYGAAGMGAIASFTRWRIGLRERELREQRRVERAREEERESIRRQNASDFHDEAGTTLTRILFLTELARRRGEGDGELREMLEKIDANASRLSQGMRDFIWVLDPDKDTLLDTLERIDEAGQSLFAHVDAGFSMHYEHRRLSGVKLDLNRRRQLLMICKEGLHNAVRHSGATSVLIRAESDNGIITVIVEDDGRGFDAGNGHAGYGLKSMRRRAESIGAELLVRSEIGVGTSVELRIPQMGD